MKELIKDLEILSKPARPLVFATDKGIEKEEGLKIIADLKEFMDANPDLIALAAPQIGIDKRVFCIRFDNDIKFFLNPIVTKKSKFEITAETFSSWPGKEFLVTRPTEISVIYYTKDFKYEDNKLLGPAAKIFDQQIQLLDGVIPSDLGLVSDIEEDGKISDLTEDELAEAISIYKKFIAAKTAELSKELKADEALEKQYKQLKFTEDVITGRTQVIVDNPEKTMNREQRRAAAKQAKKIAAKHKRGK